MAASSHSATRPPTTSGRFSNQLLTTWKPASSLLKASSLLSSNSRISTKVSSDKDTNGSASLSTMSSASYTRLTSLDGTDKSHVSLSRVCSIENKGLEKSTSSSAKPKVASLLKHTTSSGLRNPGLYSGKSSLLSHTAASHSSSVSQPRQNVRQTLQKTSVGTSSTLLSSTTQTGRNPLLQNNSLQTVSGAQKQSTSSLMTFSGGDSVTKMSLKSSLLSSGKSSLLTSSSSRSHSSSAPSTTHKKASSTPSSTFTTLKTNTSSIKPKSLLSSVSSGKVVSHTGRIGSSFTTTSSRKPLLTKTVGLTSMPDSKLKSTTAKISKVGQSQIKETNKQVEKEVTEIDGPILVVKPITKRTEGAPEYDFSAERPVSPEESKFLPPELDASVQLPPPPVVDIVGVKTTLINSVATSLLCSPDFRSSQDPTRRTLTKLGGKIAKFDPEFVLKLALYTRCDLNIRTTANFLLALASSIPACRPYLRTYFASSVRLPSDWIEVAEIYQAFHDKSLNFGSLPTALRKVMASKFTSFDEYQLAKYNKDTSKRKKKMKGKESTDKSKTTSKKDVPFKPKPEQVSSSSEDDSSEDDSIVRSENETEEEIERLSFTLKQLVRKIHIAEPVQYIMCLIGKRYPNDPEEFRRSRLPGMWDQDRAGKRMKLTTPETWETQVSTKGNKAKIWEDLIDHNKLPFMAMLRNIRNLILAQVSQKHHQWVIRKLNDERAVVNSRQFPFRFFSAYEVLSDLEKIANGEQPKAPARPTKKGAKKPKKPPKELPPVDVRLIQRYRTALDNALKIATCYNVKPISGSTLILCNVGTNMDRPCTSARGLGKPRTVLEVGILLGLMCKYSCEHCTMMLYGADDFTEVQLKEGTILNNMENVITTARNQGVMGREGNVPTRFLTNMLVDRVQYDNIVILTDSMKLDDQQGRDVIDFLNKYRHLVNPNLLFVSVDLSGRTSGVSSTVKPTHPNDIYLAGYSDQILRFIAERGDSGQLTYIDNIDKAYNLQALKLPALAETGGSVISLTPEKTLLATTQHRWRTARVFISSTFRDMHGERDMLTRFVFPELRARAHSKQINIYEVDLRWGVTEQDARSHKAMEICLGEISRSQYFVGLLGQRYGWVQDSYVVPDAPEFEWLREFPHGRSITEIEMTHAALCDTDKAVGKAFFYFRDPFVLEKIPDTHRSNFESESHEALEKIERLKSQIRFSGLEVYDGYPCQWLGIVEDKPLVGHLEDFGQRVLHNLWNAIQRDYPDDEVGQDPLTQANAFHEGFIENRARSFVGRRALLKKAQELLTEGSGKVIILAGKPGSGKSAFMAALAQHYIESESCPSSNLVISHFIGAAPDSSNIASILTRFCHEMKRRFGVPFKIPEDFSDLAKEFPEFLNESVTNIGKGSRLVLLIDAADLLEDKHNGRSMDWLPIKIPEGVTFVISGVDSGSCVANLRKRQQPHEEVIIGSLDIMDKAEMVRRKLAKHRKALEESPFNNQMKLLLTKKEATNPLYLHLACEELRVFGVFEEVTAFLKRMPPTISNLLQEILNRLEVEHTLDILSTALSLLSLVRNGLLEHELSGVLSAYFADKDVDSNDVTLPPMVISRLLRSLQSFLQPTGQESSTLLTLAHKDIEKAVRLRYMRGTASSKEKQFHQLLASYYRTETDPSGDASFKGNSARAFMELPYHLMVAGEWTQLEDMLCNIHFVVAKCQIGLAQQLLEDYTPSATSLPSGKARDLARFIQQPRLQEFKSFVSRNLHVLTSNPALTLQQAVNEPSSSTVSQAAQDIIDEYPQPLMTCINKPETTNPCAMNISGQTGVSTCVAVSQDSQLFAAGFKNCSVRVYEVQTGKEVHSFVGHAAGITSVCFVGSTAICSGSNDNTLSLWDAKNGFRIAVLKGHTRPVHGCAANTSGKTIASVSWDRTIKVWDGKSGKINNTLKTYGQHNTPINCVAFHPEGQIIAVGSWDSTVKIWDTFNQKRLKVLKGHKTAVQACTYAPSGRHIVSASLDGEVKIWSTKSGSAVGSLVGHSSPVNSIAYTPNSQYLITASNDQLIKVWSGSLGQPVLSLGSKEHGVIHCIAFEHSTQSVHVGYHDGHVRKFNIQTGLEIFAFKPHTAAVVGVAYFDPLQMSASADTTVKIWNPSIFPKCLSLIGHKAPLTCAVWEKNGFATASEDLTILVWPHNPREYQKAFRGLTQQSQPAKKGKAKMPKPDSNISPLAILNGHTAKISSISFSCDGLKMVSASNDRSLIIWDTYSYKQLKVLNACHKDWINTCAFSTNSPDFLVTGSNDFTLKLWDLKTGTEKTTFKGHTSSINSVSFSQGCIVSADFDGSVKVWTHKGVEITTMHCHKQRINSCLVNIPSKAAGASFDWADVVSEDDPSSNKRGMLDQISVVTASDDGTVGVWKPFLPNEIKALVGHSDRILSVSTTHNNEILSSSLDGSIRLWRPQLAVKPQELTTLSSERGHVGPIVSCTTVTVSKSESYIATAGRDGNFVIWHVTNDTKEGGGTAFDKLYTVNATEKAISSLCFVSFSNATKQGTIVVGKDDGSVVTYKFTPTEYPTSVASVNSGALMGAHPISKLVLTPDRRNVIAGSWSNQIVAIASNNRASYRMTSHKGWIMDMIATMENNKSVIYSIGLDQNLCRWEIPMKPAPSTLLTPSCNATKFHIDTDNKEKSKAWLLALNKLTGAPYLVISDSKGSIYLWNTETKRIVMSRKVHKKAINALASTPEGEIITCSDDCTIKVWNLDLKKVAVKQIGQFYCQSCVTSIAIIGSHDQGKNKQSMFAVGDSLGHVTMIKWAH